MFQGKIRLMAITLMPITVHFHKVVKRFVTCITFNAMLSSSFTGTRNKRHPICIIILLEYYHIAVDGHLEVARCMKMTRAGKRSSGILGLRIRSEISPMYVYTYVHIVLYIYVCKAIFRKPI